MLQFEHPPSLSQKLKKSNTNALIAFVTWSILITLSAAINVNQQSTQITNLAITQAKSTLQKDLAFRIWASKFGGFYVPVSENAQPNPYMENIPTRDVVTTEGMELTLYNPALMLRLLGETQQELFGVGSKITGEKYLNPVNAPDEWQKNALKIIDQTRSDHVDLFEVTGKQYIRMMQPMIQEESCLKCHAWTNIPVGGLRGGTDVMIPLDPIQEAQQSSIVSSMVSHFGLWLIGSIIIFLIYKNYRATSTKVYSQQDSLNKLTLAMEQSASGIIITNAAGDIEYVNERYIEICGYGWDELIGQNPSKLQSKMNPPEIYNEMWQTLTSGKQWRGELQNRKKSGMFYWCHESISPVKGNDGEIKNYVGVVEDISDRKTAESTIERLAFYDPLTNLANRRLLFKKVSECIALSKRSNNIFAVLYIDLDRFKNVNDTLGHNIGDELLIALTSRLKDTVRESDFIARLGGDEFAIILEQIDEANIKSLANKVREQICLPVQIKGHELHISCSIGVSQYPRDGKTPDLLFSNADISMYHAKDLGRNGVQFFSQSLNETKLRRIAIESELKKAIKNDEFEIHYQPKLDITTGHVIGVEALLRWHSKQLGVVSPVEFIPISEETGDILKIGLWVLRNAIKQAGQWREQYPDIVLSVNISTIQIHNSDLYQVICSVLEQYQYPAHLLELEVTESVIMDDVPQAIEVLNNIKLLGCSISIDDFGTGYSSLGQLKELPVNILKIDRVFIKNLEMNNADFTIVKSIVALAKSLDLNIIAEGVETKTQLEILRGLGCFHIQGYIFSTPIPLDDLQSLLDANSGKELTIPADC